MAHIPESMANAEPEPADEEETGEAEAAELSEPPEAVDGDEVTPAAEAEVPEAPADGEQPDSAEAVPDLADSSPRAVGTGEPIEPNFMVPTALQPEQRQPGEASTLPVADGGYTYPQFVERFKDASAQPVVNEVRDFVNEFPANLTRLQAARRIHAFLAEVTPKLLAAQAFRAGGSNASEIANEGLEKFVVLKLYKLLYRHDPADIREDERVEQAIRAGSAKGASAIQAAVSKFDAKQMEIFDAAALELQRVEQYRAPRDKLSCFVNAVRLVESIVVERVFRQKGDAPQQSNWEQLLVALILKAGPPNLYSNLEFTAAFRDPSRMSPDERKALGDLAAAFLEAIGGSSRRLTSSELTGNSAQCGDNVPLWLMDAGVTFNFSDRAADDLSLGEVDELLDEYQKMIRAIRDLIGREVQKTT